MEQELSKERLINNKNEAINRINEYLDSCTIKDTKHKKKANLLSFWFKDYINYLEQEETFNSSFLKEYSRGDIIKVNLGFNVGNEEGGLHYCVVLDKKNAKSYSTLTVVPLSSFKETTKKNKTSVFLGKDIYLSLEEKNKKIISIVTERIEKCQISIKEIKSFPENTEEEQIIKNYKINQIRDILIDNNEKLELSQKIESELAQMKKGSIALINQITTISKQRIYNPKKDMDILSGIKLSNEKMNLIDEKIKKLFLN